jgi:hypothetical protein
MSNGTIPREVAKVRLAAPVSETVVALVMAREARCSQRSLDHGRPERPRGRSSDPRGDLVWWSCQLGLASHSRILVQRRFVLRPRTAMPTAFLWLTSTTSRLPRVTPV